MLSIDEIKINLSSIKSSLLEIQEGLNVNEKNRKIEELNKKLEFNWNNEDYLELSKIQKNLSQYNSIYKQFNDIVELSEFEDEINFLNELYENFISDFEKLKIQILFSEEYDNSSAIVRLSAGAGGTEAMDWCEMLYRMYYRWTISEGFKIEVLDYLEGEVAGIKHITFKITGENAYGYLKSEKGVHRLIRISPFNAQGKRQTSFVSCEVIPEINDDININIPPEDLEFSAFRSGGAGGQNVNKVSSAVRIKHIPTGIVVTCQTERSQFFNREQAMKMLRSKLFILEKEKQEVEMNKIVGQKNDINFGSQIRTYTFHPYSLVKDHRTNIEKYNINDVMNGDLNDFMLSYLKMKISN